MIETVKHLMDCGFKITYGYTESDEISLLFDKEENGFNRKTRKLISILAGEASATFTKAMGCIGVFDCRLIPLPTNDLVIDYFRWRAEDSNRNALNAWCYWKLRESGFTVEEATSKLKGKSIGEKNELLFQLGINYNTLPKWQKRGMGLYYKWMDKASLNPITGEQVIAARRSLIVDMELPMNIEYDLMMGELLTTESKK
jgi:tRNA(His) 5'-end guanylyltransferase